MAGVCFADVTRVYRGRRTPAVDGVDLDVRDGELLVLTGPSGSGKSTLLRVLAGLEPVDRGRLYVGPRDVTGMVPDKRGVSLVFGSMALFPHLSAFENIALPLTMRRASAGMTRSLVREAAERCGLATHLAALPGELDFDLRLRITLARAIVRRPDVVCIDEPLHEGDAESTGRGVALVGRVQRDLGITLLYATGNPHDARRIADRVAVLDDGRLQQADTPFEVFDRPATLAVAAFACADRMDFAETVLRDGHALVGDLRVPVTDKQAKALTGERVVVGLRHSDMVLGARDGFRAVVVRVNDVGSHAMVHVRADVCGMPVDFQIRHAGPMPALAQRVVVGADGAQAHLFDRATGLRLCG